METRRDVFHAISDPTRREIIHLLAGKSLNFNGIAERFDISRQAVSTHITVLQECGLIAIVERGRERHCYAKLEKLKDVYSWVDQYRAFWMTQFSSLDQYLQKKSAKSNKPKGRKRKPG